MEHLYIVSYDIRCPKRWRRVFRTMNGHGEWLQLSVFQCRLDAMALLRLEATLAEEIDLSEDHVLMVDLGPAESVRPRVRSLGKVFQPVNRESVVV
jgi:CRISPR-associated protein Cas2